MRFHDFDRFPVPDQEGLGVAEPTDVQLVASYQRDDGGGATL
jgi:hypothetical protein